MASWALARRRLAQPEDEAKYQCVMRVLPVFSLVKRNDTSAKRLSVATQFCRYHNAALSGRAMELSKVTIDGLGVSVTRTVVHELATGGHGSQRVPASDDALVQIIVLKRVGRNVGHVIPRGDVFVGQF